MFAKKLVEVSRCVLFNNPRYCIIRGSILCTKETHYKTSQQPSTATVIFVLLLISNSRFLDKFVYKNPKQKKSGNQIFYSLIVAIDIMLLYVISLDHGGSIMQVRTYNQFSRCFIYSIAYAKTFKERVST